MITFHNYEAKSLENAIEMCEKDLNISIDKTYYIKKEIESGLFKGKKCILQVLTKDEIISAIKQFLADLAKNMNLEINSEINIQNDVITINLVSDNNNILIGKEGKTLNALNFITRQVFSDINKFNLKINVDIADYKVKKIKTLEHEVKKICKEVIDTKMEVKLDPMNSYERRIVHSIVSEYDNLQSISEGTEPERYTIIKFKN